MAGNSSNDYSARYKNQSLNRKKKLDVYYSRQAAKAKEAKGSSTTSLTDALLETMDIISNDAVESSTSKTLTLEAKIIEVLDEGRGIYKVKYLDNRLKAYSSNESIKYKVNDIVYIIVPEGNFDKRITILSSVSSEVSQSIMVEGPLRIPIGDTLYRNLFSMNLCSFRDEEFPINGDKAFFAYTFSNYLKDFPILLFTLREWRNW